MGIRKPTEAEFARQVIALAKLHHWRVAHFRAARTTKGWRTPVSGDGAGWPDLVLVRDGVLLFVELKTDTGNLRPDQVVWLKELRACGVVACVWRPVHWTLIEQTLRRY